MIEELTDRSERTENEQMLKVSIISH